ncbi:MAG: tetratricopeptide repeat protein [Gammaproteobacteria bacterium]|jgi:tetratricopeptide (TPR) repeat protein|nr:tetratricopeptide repeat protein [Gammaproteobacteria bacterium]
MRTLISLAGLLLSGILAGCASTPPPSDAPEEAIAVAAVAIEVEPEDIDYGSFTEEQLYQAIISELGAQRGQVEDASDNYFDLALASRDPNILRRAVQFASITGDMNALMQLGLLWSELEPDNAQPHLMLSFQFLENGNFDQALSHMARVIDLGGDMDFSALANRTGRLDPDSRGMLIENLRQLTREFGYQESIRMALVQLLAQNREYEEALLELQLLVQLVELNPAIVLLQAQILQSMGSSERALRLMRRGVRDFDDDKSLRDGYARLLIQNEDYAEAREQYQIIVEQDPQDWETLYSIALLDLEMENFERAARSLTRLIAVDQQVDESQYYLGYIYEQQQDYGRAIEHYRQVRIGTNNFLAAQQQATRFSIQLGELDDAHQWLMNQSRGRPRLEILFDTIESNMLIQNGYAHEAKELLDTALNKFPNETDLLFARVLYFDSQGDRAGSETDLRQIISMQPEDSRALNHLGYMLADQTTRYTEALELVERAIAISPDDPAIIDSLAWAQYKLGRYEEALQNLRRAFAAFPDHEVASHLGEVLWMMGRQDEANQVWQDALEVTPDSDLIREAIDRLNPG